MRPLEKDSIQLNQKQINWILYPYHSSKINQENIIFIKSLESLVGILSWGELHYLLYLHGKYIFSIKFLKTYAPKLSEGLIYTYFNDVFSLLPEQSFDSIISLYKLDKAILKVYMDCCKDPFFSEYYIKDNSTIKKIDYSINVFDFYNFYQNGKVIKKKIKLKSTNKILSYINVGNLD